MQQDAGNWRTEDRSADEHCLLQKDGRLRRISGRPFVFGFSVGVSRQAGAYSP
jgi:hypothetical protein